MTARKPPVPTPSALVKAREAAGLTQTEAGALVYVTKRSWAGWEGGERPMPPVYWELFRLKTAR
jgi:DNA-binding XRE family transcriptional regulator